MFFELITSTDLEQPKHAFFSLLNDKQNYQHNSVIQTSRE